MLSEKELKNFYGGEYVSKFEVKQSVLRLDRLVQYINFNGTETVVDFACGNGMILPLISNKIKYYLGVDFSKDFILSAKKRIKLLNIDNASFICGDINNFCSSNIDFCDIALAMDFSEHVYDESWLCNLKSIRKCLKPNGTLYLHTPNSEFFIEKMKERNFILRQFPEHIAVRNIVENTVLLEQAGFKVNSIRLLPHYNILRFLHPLSYIPFIGKWFNARLFIEAVANKT